MWDLSFNKGLGVILSIFDTIDYTRHFWYVRHDGLNDITISLYI